jgi:hypothetical protein
VNRRLWPLLLWSVKGRLLRFRRQLRRPSYLVATILGGGYLLWVFFWVAIPKSGVVSIRNEAVAFEGPEAALTVRILVALGAALYLTFAWIFTRARPRLKLSPAEIHTLLPAPLSRRQVLAFALLRNQPVIWLSTLIFTVVRGNLLLLPVFWGVLTLADWHIKGMSLWKTQWKEASPSVAWGSRGLVAGVFVLFWTSVLVRLAALWPLLAELVVALRARQIDVVREVLPRLPVAVTEAFQAGGEVAGGVLTPFLWVTAPFLPLTVVQWQGIVGGGLFLLALLGLHYLWVVGSGTRFEDAVLENARREESRRKGRPERLRGKARRRVPFPLPSQGFPELAIVWKNLLLYLRMPLRSLAVLCLIFLGLLYIATVQAGQDLPLSRSTTILVTVLMVTVPALTGMVFRADFRCELVYIELARTWPVKGWRMVLAQIAVPVFLCLLVLLPALLALLVVSLGLPPDAEVVTTPRQALLMLVAGLPPALMVSALAGLVLNLATLLFPSWIPLGWRPQQSGPANSGAVALLFVGNLLALVVGLIPAWVLAALTSLLLGWLGASSTVVLLVGSLVVTLVLLAEVVALTMAVGRCWDTLDPSKELLSE